MSDIPSKQPGPESNDAQDNPENTKPNKTGDEATQSSHENIAELKAKSRRFNQGALARGVKANDCKVTFGHQGRHFHFTYQPPDEITIRAPDLASRISPGDRKSFERALRMAMGWEDDIPVAEVAPSPKRKPIFSSYPGMDFGLDGNENLVIGHCTFPLNKHEHLIDILKLFIKAKESEYVVIGTLGGKVKSNPKYGKAFNRGVPEFLKTAIEGSGPKGKRVNFEKLERLIKEDLSVIRSTKQQ